MQNKERMNTQLMLNTHELGDGRRKRKFREYGRENEKDKERNSVSVCVFHFWTINSTFPWDWDNVWLWYQDRFEGNWNLFLGHLMSAPRAANSSPLRQQICLIWFIYLCIWVSSWERLLHTKQAKHCTSCSINLSTLRASSSSVFSNPSFFSLARV